MPFCTTCGQRLDGEDRFCDRCGAAVKRSSQAPRPAPATPDAAPTTASPSDRTDTAHPADTAHPTTGVDATGTPPGYAPEAAPGGTGSARTGPTTGNEHAAAEPSGDSDGPRWAPGEGPVPLPPRSTSARRAVLAVGLPVAMIAAALVALFALVSFLRRDDGGSTLVPRVVVPSTSAPGPTTGGPTPTGGTGSPGGTASPTATAEPRITATTARQQAMAIDVLLDEASRTPVAATVASLARCDASSIDASTAATTIQTAVNTRSRLLQELEQVPVDRLPNGATLKSTLRETWTFWREADQHYLNWARGIASGAPCNPQSPFKVAGDVAAANAARSGTQFVAMWNADVARPQHLTPRQVRDL